MLKNFLTAAYLLTLTATPVHALPYWATAIARSQCEYLAIGIDWERATEQALRDNAIWADEFTRDSEIAGAAIVHAAYQLCPNLYDEAFKKHERQRTISPAFRNQETQTF